MSTNTPQLVQPKDDTWLTIVEKDGVASGAEFSSCGMYRYPVIEAQTTWDIDPEARHKRGNERHEYWLCLPVREDA